MDERYQKTRDAMRECGADWAIITSPDAVAYCTGHAVPCETGPSPFSGGPTTAILGADGSSAIVVSNIERVADIFLPTDVYAYEGLSHTRFVNQRESYRDTLGRAIADRGVKGVIAVEPQSLPAGCAAALETSTLVDLTRPLAVHRSIKTDAEKIALGRSARAAAVGQAAFYSAVKAGRPELDVFADIRRAIETYAGERVPIAGDFISGIERTAAIGGWPSNRMIENGDPVIADLAPRIGGYWGDSCAATVVDRPSAGFLALFRAAKDALDHAIEIAKPGLRISAFDAMLRRTVARHGFSYPHHSGHSIGTAVLEWPRIVSGEQACLETGMVLMVEPGAYHPDFGGARLEWMLEITEGGCVPVAPFDHLPSVSSG